MRRFLRAILRFLRIRANRKKIERERREDEDYFALKYKLDVWSRIGLGAFEREDYLKLSEKVDRLRVRHYRRNGHLYDSPSKPVYK